MLRKAKSGAQTFLSTRCQYPRRTHAHTLHQHICASHFLHSFISQQFFESAKPVVGLSFRVLFIVARLRRSFECPPWAFCWRTEVAHHRQLAEIATDNLALYKHHTEGQKHKIPTHTHQTRNPHMHTRHPHTKHKFTHTNLKVKTCGRPLKNKNAANFVFTKKRW